MNALREIYDFITGGSIVSPIGLACAIAAAMLATHANTALRAGIFVGIIVLTLALGSREKAT